VYTYRYAQLGNRRLLVIGLITMLLLAIAFIFANNLTLMQEPTRWSRWFDQARGVLLNLADPMLLPRYLHLMVSGGAGGELAIALSFSWQRGKNDPAAKLWIASGCRWFSSATLVNFAIGLWFLTSLPTGLLTTSNTTGQLLLFSLGTGILFAIAAVVFGLSRRVIPALSCTLATIALMIAARSLLRTALLAPWFSVAQLPLAPAYQPLFFFLFFLTAGVALIVWMVRFTLRSRIDSKVRP
jgi:Na+/phosphate symporter